MKRGPPATCPLAGARAGDPEAFGEFYEQYSQRVLVFLTRRVLDPEVALDLTSETFAIALETCGQFRGDTREQEQGWLFAVARSQLTRYWRRGSVEREAVQRLGVEVPGLEEGELERIEHLAELASLRPVLDEALEVLPEEQRRAIELHVLEDRGYAEVAHTLNVSEQVVRARVSRGLRALGQLLEERGRAEVST